MIEEERVIKRVALIFSGADMYRPNREILELIDAVKSADLDSINLNAENSEVVDIMGFSRKGKVTTAINEAIRIIKIDMEQAKKNQHKTEQLKELKDSKSIYENCIKDKRKYAGQAKNWLEETEQDIKSLS